MDPSKFNDHHNEAAHYMSLCLSRAEELVSKQLGLPPADNPNHVVALAVEMMRYTSTKIASAESFDPHVGDGLREIAQAIRDIN